MLLLKWLILNFFFENILLKFWNLKNIVYVFMFLFWMDYYGNLKGGFWLYGGILLVKVLFGMLILYILFIYFW